MTFLVSPVIRFMKVCRTSAENTTLKALEDLSEVGRYYLLTHIRFLSFFIFAKAYKGPSNVKSIILYREYFGNGWGGCVKMDEYVRTYVIGP